MNASQIEEARFGSWAFVLLGVALGVAEVMVSIDAGFFFGGFALFSLASFLAFVTMRVYYR